LGKRAAGGGGTGDGRSVDRRALRHTADDAHVPHQRVRHLVARLHLESRSARTERQSLIAGGIRIHAGDDIGRLESLRCGAAGTGGPDGLIDRGGQRRNVADTRQIHGNTDLAAIRETRPGELEIGVTGNRFLVGVAAAGIADDVLNRGGAVADTIRHETGVHVGIDDLHA